MSNRNVGQKFLSPFTHDSVYGQMALVHVNLCGGRAS
jgi:hypothetical protein